MQPMTLTDDQRELMEQKVTPMVNRANGIVVKTADDSLKAQEAIKEIKLRRKAIHEKFDPPVKAAHKSWKMAKDLYNFFINPFDEAETIIKRKIVSYEAIAERKRQEEARIAEAKRIEAERKEREKLEARAQKAEEKGNAEKAEALRKQAEEVQVAPKFTPLEPEKAKGTSFVKVWKAEVTNMSDLLLSISQGKAPQNLITVNQSALNAFAKGVKNTMPVPGLKFYEDTQMRSRVS